MGLTAGMRGLLRGDWEEKGRNLDVTLHNVNNG
jgi:hypothetical protein